MTETTELRAVPGNICMSEAMPYQQHWEYRTTWPLAETLHDQFFLNVRNQLRAGDSITLCRYDGMSPGHKGISLLEVATVRVISSGGDDKVVPIALMGPIAVFGESKPAAAPFTVEAGHAGKHKLVQGGTLIKEFGSRQEAEAELKRRVAA